MAKKEVVKKEEGALISQERPDFMNNESNRGQEGVGIDDLTIPRLGLIQDLSPQRKKTDAAYIEGAEEGMLFNTVTNVLYGTSIMFVPVYYRKEWVIWKAQSEGGGYCGAYPTEHEAKVEWESQGYEGQVNKKGEPIYEVNDTGQQFGLVVHEDGTTEDIVISFSKSKRKIDRQLNTMVKMAGGDRFSRVYKISAVSDQNSAGQDFYNYGVSMMGFVNEETYRKGEKLYDAISSGQRDIKREEPEEEAEY